MAFLGLAHTCEMLRNWWCGVGGEWWHSLTLHTCGMLSNWWCGVWGVMTFLDLAHMWDAKQLMVWGVGGWWRSLNLHTCEMLRNWWCGVGGGWWHSLTLHTCEMLSNWWCGVWGVMTFLELAHMRDATPPQSPLNPKFPYPSPQNPRVAPKSHP